MDEELCLGNPVQLAKKDCKRLVKDAQVKETKRLDQDEWNFLLDTARQMVEEDSIYERNLFLIAAMKTLFLRISELSERSDWIPVMSHFWQDDEKNWWLKIYGKGRKLRDISVPDSFCLIWSVTEKVAVYPRYPDVRKNRQFLRKSVALAA